MRLNLFYSLSFDVKIKHLLIKVGFFFCSQLTLLFIKKIGFHSDLASVLNYGCFLFIVNRQFLTSFMARGPCVVGRAQTIGNDRRGCVSRARWIVGSHCDSGRTLRLVSTFEISQKLSG